MHTYNINNRDDTNKCENHISRLNRFDQIEFITIGAIF